MGAFVRIGVKAVLACGNRNRVADSGWQRIHGTSCLIYLTDRIDTEGDSAGMG